MAKGTGTADDPIIIKKYANRRLYNTGTSSYITLDDLAQMTRENVEFEVVDAKSGDDITHSILTQIIMEEEAGGEQLLPVSFLRQLISMYGNSMQALMPPYLDASMKFFRENQSKLGDTLKSGMAATPLGKLHEANMAMFRAATETLLPGSTKPADAAPTSKDEELAALRKQMAAMQEQLDKLAK